MSNFNHTFVICAYKESPYLEECILSLKQQVKKTNIIMVTSTPNDLISSMSEKYDIPLFVNEGQGGITQDWNFGLSKIETEYATIAHQDDIYDRKYVMEIAKLTKKSKKPLILFADYGELRNGQKVNSNTNLKIKRILLFMLRFRIFWPSIFVRRRSLSLGCGIACPSVTFSLKNLKQPIFEHGYRSVEDWQAWERISKFKGEFVYCPKILMYHRIHEESETSKIIEDNQRSSEEYDMFIKFWPKPIAKLINNFYKAGQKSNDIN
ncbi:MAG: glycosyltransferase family 2 protein [Lachnospiraceae bacterium]|nr:glycosyltransferase family 2 protein [Lachnospiraceae bacterium]